MFFLQAAVLLFMYLIYHYYYGKRRGYPPGPMPLPIVGNIFQLDRRYPDETIARWSREYKSGMITVWLPEANVCIVSNALLREVFVRRGAEFTSKARSYMLGITSHNYMGLFFSSGRPWLEQRRFTMRVLRELGMGRNVMHEQVMREVRALVRTLETAADERAPVDLWQPLEVCTLNALSSITLGYRFSKDTAESERFRRANFELLRRFEGPGLRFIDNWPWLRHFANLGLREFVEAKQTLVQMMQQLVDRRKAEGLTSPPQNFIDAYLQELERVKDNAETADTFNEGQLGAVIHDLLAAGVESTPSVLYWAVVFLLRHPQVQTKLQAEIDRVVGGEREVCMADRVQLPYTMATVHEMKRLANVVPLPLKRMAERDTQIAGYHIKAGTHIMPMWATGLIEEATFKHAHEFIPERFLDANGRVARADEAVAFGLGKRQCAGEGLAMMEIFVIIVTLMQKFSLSADEIPSLEPQISFIRKPLRFTCRVAKR